MMISTRTRRLKMSAWPAMKFSPTHAGDFEMKNTTRSRSIRQGSFVLAVALAVAACTGGAGLDIPIGPVEHSCPANSCGPHK